MVTTMMAVRDNEVYCDKDVKYRINNKLYTTEQVLEAMKIYEKLDKATLTKSLNKYGVTAQEDICIEETAELTKAILKVRRAGKFGQYNINDCISNLIEEIADVEISLEYLKLIQEQTNSNFRNRVNEMIRYKIKRIKLRMDGDSNGN